MRSHKFINGRIRTFQIWIRIGKNPESLRIRIRNTVKKTDGNDATSSCFQLFCRCLTFVWNNVDSCQLFNVLMSVMGSVLLGFGHFLADPEFYDPLSVLVPVSCVYCQRSTVHMVCLGRRAECTGGETGPPSPTPDPSVATSYSQCVKSLLRSYASFLNDIFQYPCMYFTYEMLALCGCNPCPPKMIFNQLLHTIFFF